MYPQEISGSKTEVIPEVPAEVEEQPLVLIQHSALVASMPPQTPEPPSVRETIAEEAIRWGTDPQLAINIVSCEGGFEIPEQCNIEFGCKSGQGHFQFIPTRWASTVKRMGDLLPDYCRDTDSVFKSFCNISAGTWLLATDGDGHWREWSGWCYLNK